MLGENMGSNDYLEQLVELLVKQKQKSICQNGCSDLNSLESLEERLRGRGSETEEQLQLRLGAAKAELSNYKLYDYIIVNDDLERAAEELTAVLRSLRFLTNTLKKEIF